MKLVTQFGIIDCKNNIEIFPKYVLQSFLHFINVEFGRFSTKKWLVKFIVEYKNLEKEIRSKRLKKIPLVEYLQKENENDKKERLKGGKVNQKEMDNILLKCQAFFTQN